ncbi:trypsin domain-containing protein [Ditylenchus destructor]|uniref:Trypsin domain-containing protein n=1 Tax=Ditylenchus destructor TaxID=166010 RepID=A0AAD4MRN2_9BILA|nr:trypsin domain-containing protein [Ditylenchus destructor]
MNISRFALCVILAVFAVASATSPEEECGTTDYPGHHAGERIINGTEVPQGKYPWLVNIHIESVAYSVCTATIVSKKWILTAAHCIEPEEMTVAVGSVDNRKGKVVKIKRSIMHEGYEAEKGPHDIALIELSEDLTYSKDVRRICLSENRQEADPSKNVVITGWGWLNGHAKRPRVLHEGSARVVADDICDKFSKKCLFPVSTLDLDACTGDSGGPALVNLEGRWTQIGVADYVYNPLDLTKPSGYARVSYFCDWISEKTDNEVQCDK